MALFFGLYTFYCLKLRSAVVYSLVLVAPIGVGFLCWSLFCGVARSVLSSLAINTELVPSF